MEHAGLALQVLGAASEASWGAVGARAGRPRPSWGHLGPRRGRWGSSGAVPRLSGNLTYTISPDLLGSCFVHDARFLMFVVLRRRDIRAHLTLSWFVYVDSVLTALDKP